MGITLDIPKFINITHKVVCIILLNTFTFFMSSCVSNYGIYEIVVNAAFRMPFPLRNAFLIEACFRSDRHSLIKRHYSMKSG